MKISGTIKEKLDAAMEKVIEKHALTPEIKKRLWESKQNQWSCLHYAMTKPEFSPQNNTGNPMDSLMNEIYKTCNDDHLNTYLKNYFKVWKITLRTK